MFYAIEKITRRVEELEQRRFTQPSPVAPFQAMEGQLEPDEIYRELPGSIQGKTMTLGDFFPGKDRYLWLQKTLTIPQAREGFEIVGRFDFGNTSGGFNSGFESLLYLDGTPYQAVDTYHWDVPLQAFAGQQVTMTFLLWTGMGGQDVEQVFFHQLRRAEICYLHKDCDRLYYLCRAAVETAKILDEGDNDRIYLLEALEHAMLLLNWDADAFYDTVPQALEYLTKRFAARKTDSEVTVHMVGHTHIDVAWLWRLKHTREKAQRSFTTALRLMEEFPSFVFLQTQPQLYRFIQQDRPDLFQKIAQKVSQGQWETDGGMWLEADCNISSGESLTRQFLHGIRFFQQQFQKTCRYLWLPDVFGYSWALPQILKQCGIETFMTTKISWNQFNTMPNDLFSWRGIDGTEVLTYFIQVPPEDRPIDGRFSTYNGTMSPRTVLGSWKKFRNKELSKDVLIAYGYGDGGGGVTRDMLKLEQAMEQIPGLPNLKLGKAGDFFASIHRSAENAGDNLPTWDGELYLEYHRGTYTTQANNKKWNRYLEFKLAQTEWLGSLCALCGHPYPQKELYDGWETVLRNQFHDIIPGSSIHEVYADSGEEYRKTNQTLDTVRAGLFAQLSNAQQNTYTAFHFGSFPRRDLLLIPETEEGVFTALNRDGSRTPLESQRVDGGYLVDLSMDAASMQTLAFQQAAHPQAPAPSSFSYDPDSRTLQTPHYRIRWDENGRMISVYDLDFQREVLGKKGGGLELFEDKPMNYDAWDIDIYYTQKRESPVLESAPQVLEDGALQMVLGFTYRYHHSVISQKVTFYRDSRRIDFITDVDWQESHRLLKAAFDLNIRTTKATYDIQYGHVERPNHWNTSWDYARFEVVGHKWADLSESNYGAALLSDCKYGYSAKDSTLTLSLLRSPKRPDPQADMGKHHFTYALLPHEGTVVQSDVIAQSVSLNLPLQYFEGASLHSGKALVHLGHPGVYLDAWKQAEDGDGFVLRIHECLGGSLKTVLTSDYPIRKYARCNLLEEPQEQPVSGDNIPVSLHPFEICSYRIWF